MFCAICGKNMSCEPWTNIAAYYANPAHKTCLVDITRPEGHKDDSAKLEMAYLGKTATWWGASKSEAYKISGVADTWWFHNEEGLSRALQLIERDLTLSPESYLAAVIAVRKFGAEKYGLLNYRSGMAWSRLFSAFRRHIYYYPILLGEELDKDTNQPHWAHAACCLMFLQEYVTESLGLDDRHEAGVK